MDDTKLPTSVAQTPCFVTLNDLMLFVRSRVPNINKDEIDFILTAELFLACRAQCRLFVSVSNVERLPTNEQTGDSVV